MTSRPRKTSVISISSDSSSAKEFKIPQWLSSDEDEPAPPPRKKQRLSLRAERREAVSGGARDNGGKDAQEAVVFKGGPDKDTNAVNGGLDHGECAKRTRGRPRKHPIQAADARDTNKDDSDLTPLKRSPGRPRKQSIQGGVPAGAISGEESAATPSKRKPGRPRKDLIAGTSAEIMSRNRSESDVTPSRRISMRLRGFVAAASPPVTKDHKEAHATLSKRGRGRPIKHPLADFQASAPSLESIPRSVPPSMIPSKRPRGRPPKPPMKEWNSSWASSSTAKVIQQSRTEGRKESADASNVTELKNHLEHLQSVALQMVQSSGAEHELSTAQSGRSMQPTMAIFKTNFSQPTSSTLRRPKKPSIASGPPQVWWPTRFTKPVEEENTANDAHSRQFTEPKPPTRQDNQCM